MVNYDVRDIKYQEREGCMLYRQPQGRERVRLYSPMLCDDFYI